MSRSLDTHSQQFALPTLAPLKRLAVRNGLLLDAERWQIAHDYHRQRQNLHYQALHLPGIVCGLEVAVVPPPDEVSARYRDERWLQISPGVAIDAHGNLVVVDQPIKVHLAPTTEPTPHWVYLVVRHVDPEGLQRSQPADIVAETFRIDEKKQPPGALDVEVCRVLLPPDDTPLAAAADVFRPGLGELDLRYRQPAQLRPQATVRVAYATTGLPLEDARIHRSLTSLLAATQALYPTLQGDREVAAITLGEPPSSDLTETANAVNAAALEACDFLYLTHRQALSLSSRAIAQLQQYLHHGGGVFVELPSRDGNFEEMQTVVGELATAVADLQGSQRFVELRSQLESELAAVTHNLDGRLANAQRSLLHHLYGDDASPQLQAPDDDHPLRQTPFAFSQWPIIRTESIRLYAHQGLILSIGDLSHAWAASSDLGLSRERVRAAQELGINLLHFAWQRHHWTQAQQPPPD